MGYRFLGAWNEKLGLNSTSDLSQISTSTTVSSISFNADLKNIYPESPTVGKLVKKISADKPPAVIINLQEAPCGEKSLERVLAEDVELRMGYRLGAVDISPSLRGA